MASSVTSPEIVDLQFEEGYQSYDSSNLSLAVGEVGIYRACQLIHRARHAEKSNV